MSRICPAIVPHLFRLRKAGIGEEGRRIRKTRTGVGRSWFRAGGQDIGQGDEETGKFRLPGLGEMRVGIGFLSKFEICRHIFRVKEGVGCCFRTGSGEAADQVQAGAGQDLGIAGQEGVRLHIIPGGYETIDSFMVQIDPEFSHVIDDPGPGVGGLEGQAGVALGPGRGHGGSSSGIIVI